MLGKPGHRLEVDVFNIGIGNFSVSAVMPLQLTWRCSRAPDADHPGAAPHRRSRF